MSRRRARPRVYGIGGLFRWMMWSTLETDEEQRRRTISERCTNKIYVHVRPASSSCRQLPAVSFPVLQNYPLPILHRDPGKAEREITPRRNGMWNEHVVMRGPTNRFGERYSSYEEDATQHLLPLSTTLLRLAVNVWEDQHSLHNSLSGSPHLHINHLA